MNDSTLVEGCPDVRFPKHCPRCQAETVRADYWAQTGTHPSRLCEHCGWSAYDSMTFCAWCGDPIYQTSRLRVRYCSAKPCLREVRALYERRYRERRRAS